MMPAIDSLPNDPEALKAMLLEELKRRDAALQQAKNRIAYLEELVKLFNHRAYGPSSEKWPGQTLIFNEPEADAADRQETLSKVGPHERKRGHRRPLPDIIPRIDIVHELSESDRACECGGRLEEISEEISEQLDIVPAVVQVLRHRRKKYACPCCKANVKTAAMPPQPLPKTNASPGLLAYVATAKYVDHLPLYRQEEIFRRIGVDMSRATLARWMIDVAELLRPLYNLMQDDLLSGATLLMDETPVQVLKGTGKSPTAKCYMWVRCRYGPRPIIIFTFDPSRGTACARDLLEGYEGNLVTDGYEVYDRVVATRSGLNHSACWDHARRRFHDAVKAEGKDSGPSLAKAGLSQIQALYAVEREVANHSARRRQIVRNLYSKSILEHLKAWLDRTIGTVRPKSLTGKALSYLNEQWPKLTRYISDGDIPISNALAENAIRPFALGKKNWLFSDTRAGAEASSMLYSLIETAKANGQEPYAYLAKILALVPAAKTEADLTALLPYNLRY